MMNLDEAIQHCEEKAKELRTEAEQLRDIGDAISNSKQPYNEPVKNCRECAEEYEQLAEWLMELKKLREENVNQFLNSKNIILALIEENKALRKQRPQGEWIYGEDDCGQDGWFCSECNFFVPWYYQYYEKDIDFIRDYKVCPHCLAEMVTYTGKDRDTKGGEEE